jgi:2-keto-4-pentenoate hydratase
MDAAAIAKAGRLLAEARISGVPIERLPEDCRPASVAEANAVGDATAALLGEPLGGWKISFLFKPRQAPWLTPLFASRILDAGDGAVVDIPLSLTPSLCIEPEITFRVLRDLPPRERPYDAGEVAGAVIACPSFEVVDTRYDTSRRSIRQMIDGGQRADGSLSIFELFADHQTSGAFVPGAGVAGWRDYDFREVPVTMTADGAEIVSSVGGHAFGDPFLPLVVLANIMRRRQGLVTGQLLATGSFTGFFRVKPGQTIVADFAGFGRVAARFVAA